MWRTEEEFSISPWKDNVFAFGFKNKDDLCRIMSTGPWSVMGYLLILRKWDSKKAFSELDFDFSPSWVQIHGLPLGFLNAKSGAGDCWLDWGNHSSRRSRRKEGMSNYLRVRVWVDVTKPLKKGFFLRRAEEEDLWVRFKYECLSEFCYGCAKIGHCTNECKDIRSFTSKDWHYDNSLRAENAVIGIIQYGDKPLPTLVYPEIRVIILHLF